MRAGTILAWALLASFALVPGLSSAQVGHESLRSLNGPPASSARLCLLLSDNTRKTFDYVNEMRSGFAGATGAMAGFDSRRMVADIASTLRPRFREVATIDAPADIASRGCQLALALDIKMTLTPGIRKGGRAEIAGVFADNAGGRIDAIAADANRTTWNAIGEAAAEAWEAAIAEFGQKLDRSAPLLAFLAGASPGAQAASGDAALKIELAFWESIKASASPADFQSYLQQFPNGSYAGLARLRVAALGEPVAERPVPAPPLGGSTDSFGNYHALVIGNDNYRSVTPLKTAIHDARTVAEMLKTQYGFKVTLLLDATRNQTLDAFDAFRRTLTERDNLLVFYAGHGFLDKDSDRGFWLPVDAEASRRANWLSNSDLADFARAIRAKHVLVVADSCYAGTLTRSLSVQMSGLDDMSRLAQKRARTALVSGGLEPVEDAGGGGHSVFAKAFLDTLMANTGVVDMGRIFSSMRRQVILNAQQTPQYGDIRQTGHDGGDFIFVRRRPSGL